MNQYESEFISAGILFFDMMNYSKLNDDELRIFHRVVYPQLYNSIVQGKKTGFNEFVYMNTWGDGVVLIHTDFERLAVTALSMCEFFNRYDYSEDDRCLLLQKKNLKPRISLHYGEFISAFDPFQNRQSYFGRNIVLPARIEPKTPAGRVWVTDNLKIQIEDRYRNLERNEKFGFFDQGEIPLAKRYGTSQVWELYYKNENPPSKLAISGDQSNGSNEGGRFDEVRANKIHSIIKRDLSEIGFPNCHKEGFQHACHAQTNMLCLVSELVRNSQAINETRKFLMLNIPIIETAEVLRDSLEKRDTKAFWEINSMVGLLRRSFTTLLNFFVNLDRDYSDKKDWEEKPMMRFRHFILSKAEHLTNLTPEEGLEFVQNFEIVFSVLNIDLAGVSGQQEIINKLSSNDFIDPLSFYAEKLMLCRQDLEILSDARNSLTANSIMNSLNISRLREFEGTVDSCIESLPHNCGRLPKIWAW